MSSTATEARKLAACIDILRVDRRSYFFEAAGYKILFRIDGLLSVVSDDVFAIGTALRDGGNPTAAYLCGERGEALRRDLSELIDAEVIGSSIADYVPFYRKRREPNGMLIMITQTCNLACLYCYADAGTYGSKVSLQTEQQALQAVDSLLASSPTPKRYKITFFGGEPLLNFPLIRRIVDYCESLSVGGKSFGYSITTNGTMITDEAVEFFRHHRFTVMVSFDGARQFQDTYRPKHDGSGSFDAVRNGIRKLADAHLPFQIRATVVRDMINQESLESVVAESVAAGGRKVLMSPVDCSQKDRPGLGIDQNAVDRLQTIYENISQENINRFLDGDESPIAFDAHVGLMQALATGTAVGMGRCGACGGMSAVSTEGTMYPCHRFVGMHDYAVGHASTGLDEEKVASFFSKVEAAYRPKCSGCMARLICGGMCYYSMADSRGGFQRPDDAACQAYLRHLKAAVGYLMQMRDMGQTRGVRFQRALSGLAAKEMPDV